MIFQQFYSGSSGNLYTLTAANGKRLLIECGLPWRVIQAALNYDLSEITGCLLSHSHADHCKSADDCMKAGIDVYASPETLEAIGIQNERRAMAITPGSWRHFDFGISVYSFETHHDVPCSLGFVIRENDEFLLFATDTSHITQQFKNPFSIIGLECSYDKDVLQARVDANDINETLAKRLLTSHLEKENTKRYLREFCNLSRCRQIHLLHLSKDNIDAEAARLEIEKEFFIETVIV